MIRMSSTKTEYMALTEATYLNNFLLQINKNTFENVPGSLLTAYQNSQKLAYVKHQKFIKLLKLSQI